MSIEKLNYELNEVNVLLNSTNDPNQMDFLFSQQQQIEDKIEQLKNTEVEVEDNPLNRILEQTNYLYENEKPRNTIKLIKNNVENTEQLNDIYTQKTQSTKKEKIGETFKKVTPIISKGTSKIYEKTFFFNKDNPETFVVDYVNSDNSSNKFIHSVEKITKKIQGLKNIGNETTRFIATIINVRKKKKLEKTINMKKSPYITKTNLFLFSFIQFPVVYHFMTLLVLFIITKKVFLSLLIYFIINHISSKFYYDLLVNKLHDKGEIDLYSYFKRIKPVSSTFAKSTLSRYEKLLGTGVVSVPNDDDDLQSENIVSNITDVNPLSNEWRKVYSEVFKFSEEKWIIPKYEKKNEYYSVHYIENPYLTVSHFRKKKNEIQNFLGKEVFSISKNGNSGIKVEVIMEDFDSKGMYKIEDIDVKPSKDSSVVLALSVKGWHEWDLDDAITPHLALAGTSGSGKSAFSYSIIDGFSKKKDFLLIFGDPKWVSFPRYRKKGYLVLRENKEIADMLISLSEEIEKRNTLFEQHDFEKLSQYNEAFPENVLPRIVFICDEFATFTSDNGKEGEFTRAEKEYERVLRMGRSSGVHMMVMFQDPLAESFGGGKYRNLFTYLIAGYLSKENYSEMMLGNDNKQASEEKKTGTFYINGVDPEIVKVRSPFVDVDGGEPNKLRDKMSENKFSHYVVGEGLPKKVKEFDNVESKKEYPSFSHVNEDFEKIIDEDEKENENETDIDIAIKEKMREQVSQKKNEKRNPFGHEYLQPKK